MLKWMINKKSSLTMFSFIIPFNIWHPLWSIVRLLGVC